MPLDRCPCGNSDTELTGRRRLADGRAVNQKSYCSRACAGIARTFEARTTNYPIGGAFAALERTGKLACERCGDDRIGVLCIHHRDRDTRNNVAENLEMLCANCHAIEHWSETQQTVRVFRNVLIAWTAVSRGMPIVEGRHAIA